MLDKAGTPLPPSPPRTTPGLRALLRERNPGTGTEPARDFGFLKWPLLLADLLLCVLAMMLVWQNPGTAQITLGILSVVLGAWLGCLAFWLE